MSYVFLAGAVICEVTGTMLLPITQNFTKPAPTVALSILYICSFYLLTFSIKTIPIAIVYSTWAGLGIFSISILGYIIYDHTLTWQTIAGLCLIVIGVIIVNTFTSQTIN
tara:strand:- start:271 stop:600 length:330 start_codon:yes stop_codon:yes gene_type:complete